MKMSIGRSWGLASLIVLLVACGTPAGTGGGAATNRPAGPAVTAGPPGEPANPTADDVIKAVAAGVAVTEWPNTPDPGEWDHCVNATSTVSCWNGDSKASKLMVFYGDSYAGMWAPGMTMVAKDAGWRVERLIPELGACPVPDFPTWNATLKRRYTECDDFRATAVDKIRDLHPDILFLSSAFQTATMEKDGKPTREGIDDAWKTGLTSMLGKLKPLAGRIVILGDIANSEQVPIDCLTSHPHDVPACNTPRDKGVAASHIAMEQQVAKDNGVDYVDPVPWQCTDAVCPQVIAGYTVYRNRSHISLNYSLWIGPVVWKAAGLEVPAGH